MDKQQKVFQHLHPTRNPEDQLDHELDIMDGVIGGAIERLSEIDDPDSRSLSMALDYQFSRMREAVEEAMEKVKMRKVG